MSEVKDFFNIIFFTTMSIVAILSYLQARKTLFSPIRTEVFKIQIEELKNVLVFFNKQSSFDFDRDFDTHEILKINVFNMHQAYVKTFFSDKLELNEEIENHYKNASCGMIIPAKNLRAITAGSELEEHKAEEKELTPAMQLAKWKEFEMTGIAYTQKYQDKLQELLNLAASPLLPKELTDLIYKFHKTVTENIIFMMPIINRCAQELPTKYPSAEDNIKFRSDWIWNEYNNERKNMEAVSEKILSFINSHLKINEIMR